MRTTGSTSRKLSGTETFPQRFFAFAVTDDDVSQSSQSDSSAHTDGQSSRLAGLWKRLSVAAAIVAVCWYVLLISVAAFFGNPVTLNRLQLLESTLIISGTVAADGTVSHANIWKGVAPKGVIKIESFTWDQGDYILPLIRKNGGLTVTPSHLPDNIPLVYPANNRSLNELQSILKQHD